MADDAAITESSMAGLLNAAADNATSPNMQNLACTSRHMLEMLNAGSQRLGPSVSPRRGTRFGGGDEIEYPVPATTRPSTGHHLRIHVDTRPALGLVLQEAQQRTLVRRGEARTKAASARRRARVAPTPACADDELA